MNSLEDKNIKLDNFTLNYRLVTVCYIAFEVLNRYFGQVIQ